MNALLPVWLTRPLDDNVTMMADLYHAEIPCINAPIMHIEHLPLIHPETPDAILLTSRHATHALNAEWREKPLYCVGDATAAQARAQGFEYIITGTGNLLSLLPLIADDMANKRLLYLSGEDVAVDVPALLQGSDVTIDRQITYRAIASKTLPPEIQTRLHTKQLGSVTFFSPRSAEIAIALIRHHELHSYTEHVDAFCLSLEVAKAAAQLPWRSLQVASSPTRAAMLEMIHTHYRKFNA